MTRNEGRIVVCLIMLGLFIVLSWIGQALAAVGVDTSSNAPGMEKVVVTEANP